MKITVFTSNQPRHLHLLKCLSAIATEVYAVTEVTTIHPGLVDDFYRNSEPMQRYFSNVIRAEQEVFGCPAFSPPGVQTLALKMGDLNKSPIEMLKPALDSDAYIVFGASYIKGELCDFLVSKQALNIHMGVSPYFRGSGCNFWAIYDGRPDLVGATIHLLTSGLDSGPMLFHALPPVESVDGFVLGMKAVESAHLGLVEFLSNPGWRSAPVVPQSKEGEIRYSRYKDFTDDVVEPYLANLMSPNDILKSLEKRNLSMFVRPTLG